MIKVACLSCSAPYDLDERRLPASGLRMRCPKCGTSFAVFPDGRVEPAATPAGPKKTQLGIAPPANPPPASPPAAAAPKTAAPKGLFGASSSDDADLPAPARPASPAKPVVPKPAAAQDDLGLDLPAPAPSRPQAAPARAPIAMAPTPAKAPPAKAPVAAGPGDLELDLPAPRGAAPAKAAPADLELDLPAPSAAKPAPAAGARKPPIAPPVDLDLPAPRGAAPAKPAAAADLDFDLPARAAPRAPAVAKPTSPARPAAPGMPVAAPMPVAPAMPAAPERRAPIAPPVELDLPAPRAAAKPGAPAAAEKKAPIAPPVELDLPAPRSAVAKPGAPQPKAPIAPPVELDLPAPRSAARPAAAAAARAPGGDLDLDLPAPRGAKPAAAAAAPGLDLDLPAPRATKPAAALDLDLPAPRGAKPAAAAPVELDLDLPAPRTAAAKRPATLSGKPSALADASRTPFDDDLDLPAPASGADLPAPKAAKRADLDFDLPAPKGGGASFDLDLPAPRGRAAEPGDEDPTLMGQRPGVLAAADDAFGDLDLPMPKSGGGREFGDLDLPAPRGAADLPAVSTRGVDLPTPRAVDLPAPRAVDLPAPGRVDLPTPSAAYGSGGGDGFGDLELPLPGSSPPRASSPLAGAAHDDLELPLPPGAGRSSRPPAGGAQRGHGELDLGDAGAPGDDMEFADIPQAEPNRAVAPVAGRGSMEPAIAPATAKKPAKAEKPAAAPGRSRAPVVVGGLFVLLAIGGGALSLTPYGAFGVHAIEPYLPWGAGDPAQVAQVIQQADELASHDVRADSLDALRQLGTARHEAGLNRALLSRSLLHEALFDRRFGGDVGIATSAAAIRQRLEERGLDDPEIALGIAADELRQGDTSGAASFVGRARQHAASDPFVDVVDGEIALAEDRPADAATAFRAGAEHGGGAAAQWGLARALLATEGAEGGASAADVDAAIEATLAASPRHAGARVAKARRLWDHGDEDAALALARQVVGAEPVEGQTLSASGRDRTDAWVLLGTIHERRGRTHHAREAYESATQIDGTRVDALLGAGRTLLADRPSDALARFESVLEVQDAASQPALSGRSARDEARLGRSRALMAVDRIEEARTELETLAGELAEDAEVALWLGRAEERLDHDDAAEQHYRESVRLAPATFDGYLALARLYVEADRNEDALAVLEQARSQVPESGEMREELGRFELARNRLPQAITELRRALELDPALPAASFSLGVALRRSGQLDEASHVFERTAELDPGHPGLALERGLLYEARGEADRAVEFYQAALRDHPDDAELLLRLGAAQVAADHVDEAAATLEQVQRMLPSSAEAEHFLGRVAFARGQLPEASSHFERSLSLDATRGEFFLYAAWAQIELGNIGRALDRANTAIERDPSLGDAYWIRARVRRSTGAPRDALVDLTRALELKPERVEALAEMGECHDQLRQLPQAIAAYERAVAARDTQGEWWYRLGRLRLDAGQRAEAARALARATLLGDAATPQPHWLADAHRLHGDALRLGGERAGAIEHYRRYLELAPAGAIDRTEVRQAMMDLGAVPPD